MEAVAPGQQAIDPMLERRRSHDSTLFHVPLRASDAARSAKNISLWKSYLPTACVRTMIRMGWDYTT
jgi:hypothetical protein